MTDWEKIRTGFVKDGLSYRALSREFAASYSTIQRRGIKEDWPGQREEYLEENVGEKMKQNELALQFYQLGFFAEGQADQALACMSMMEFEGKDELMQRLAYNGTMQRELAMYQQYALALTQKYEPDKAGALMESITGRAAGGKRAKKAAKLKGKESSRMERARSTANSAALPGGGR